MMRVQLGNLIKAAIKHPVKAAVCIATLAATPFATIPSLKTYAGKSISRPLLKQLEMPGGISNEEVERHEQHFLYIYHSLREWLDAKNLSRLEPSLETWGEGFQIEPIEPSEWLPRRETVINDMLADITPKIENWEDYPVTDADRDFVRNPCNFNHELTMTIVKHKNYMLEEEDIKIYLAKRKSMFAKGVELNQGFKVALQKFNP